MIVLDPISMIAPGVLVSSNVVEDDAAPAQSLTKVYALSDRVMDMDSHIIYESKMGVRAVVTITVAATGVVNSAAHGLALNMPVSFESTGALPSGLQPNKVYYVTAPAANSYSVSATVGGSAIAFTGTQSGTHSAVAGQNFNRVLGDKTYWLPVGSTNRYRMFDSYNNTQTERAESILFSLKPSAIAQGMFLGNLDAAEIVVIATDPVAGVVYQEAESLRSSNAGSSFYQWLFGGRRQKTYFLTLNLPLYYNATVTVEIKKPGGVAKCGMCRLGPLKALGGSMFGLSTDIKDYSTTKFNFDGTSETTERGFSKRMSVDVEIDNAMIDDAQEWLAARRQRSLVYIGAKQYGSTVLCGKFSSFKNVIEGVTKSKMALQIEGTV